MKFLLGRRYNRTKKAVGAPAGNDNASKQTGQNVTIVSTAETLATQYGVSERTVKRAGADAALLDAHPEMAAAVIRGA
jgi:hypothetical protein